MSEDRPMPATQAQIDANRRNARLSSGPKTEVGKNRSRANALKHGLTGAGVVLHEEDAAEVERLARAFQDELKPPGEAGQVLVRRMATLAVRMERSVEQEAAALSRRVRDALDRFEAPEGVDAEEAERLRAEAGGIALFDPSREAALARKYEAAAERGFFRALKEIRQLKKEPGRSQVTTEAAQVRASLAQLGSFLQGEPSARPAAPPAPSKAPTPPSKPLPVPSKPLSTGWDPFAPDAFYVPFAIGKAR
jgi:hypothetical protein